MSATLGSYYAKEISKPHVREQFIQREARQQIFLILTGSLTLATSLAFNEMMNSFIRLLAPANRLPSQVFYFTGLLVVTVLVAILLKLSWIS